MITYIALLRPKTGVGINHNIEVLTGPVWLGRLWSKLPGVVSVQFGRNFNRATQDFRYVLVVRFLDSAALAAFLGHLEVQDIFVRLQPFCQSLVEVDIPDVTQAWPSDYVFLKSEVEGRLQALFAKVFGIDPRLVTLGANLFRDFDVHPVTLVELQMALEEMFGSIVSDEEFERFETVGDIQHFLKSKGVL